MHSICLLRRPTMISRISGSSLANKRNGRSWQEESRSHMAGISPVMTKIRPCSSRRIVVLRVLEIQFSNITEILCSAPNLSFTLEIIASIEEKLLITIVSFMCSFKRWTEMKYEGYFYNINLTIFCMHVQQKFIEKPHRKTGKHCTCFYIWQRIRMASAACIS